MDDLLPMKFPLVSVIVPNYNNEAFIAKCFDSLLKQTYSNIEIIFVDDCSTDQSVKIVKSYQKLHQKINIIQNPVNMGVSVTRNIGLITATGKYVTTLDSDDEYLPKKIEQEVRVLENRGRCDFAAYSDLIVRYKDKDVLLSPNISPSNDASNLILFRKGSIPRDLMFHREKIEQLKYRFDRKLDKYEDWDFMIRLLNDVKLLFSGEVGVIYNQHEYGLSRGSILNHMYWTSIVFMKNYKTTSWVKRLFGICCVFVNMLMHKVRLIR